NSPEWNASPPTVVVPNDMTVAATGPDGATVSYGAVTAIDNYDGPVPASCSTPSGDRFPLGATTVTCSATDRAGTTGTASFVVKVVDTTPPAIDLRDHVKAEAAGPDGATVDLGATAKDLVDGAVDVSCTPASGTRFALGDTPVSCSATDHAGNEATATTTVT